MKKLLIGLMLCGLSSVAFAQKAPNLVIVDVDAALQGYQNYQEAKLKTRDSFISANDELKPAADEVKQLQEELQALQEELGDETKMLALSESGKEEKQAEFREKYEAFQAKGAKLQRDGRAIEQQYAQGQQEDARTFLRHVQAEIEKVCKARGADMCLNANAQIVLYADSVYDITADVIQGLNSPVPAE